MAMLHSVGIEGNLAREITAGAARPAKKGREALRAWLIERVRERISVQESLIAAKGPRIVACVGPTGVGKTTTLAKLAARAKLDLGRSVGVVSLDTFRVGAVEQWQRYARLIGMPFFAARDEDDFARALASMDTDILLVDTEGHVAGDGAPLQRLGASLEHATGWDTNVMLVVPAWLRGADVDRLVRSYPAPRPTAVVATKLDEATRVGGVLHACLPTNAPLAYLCDGPRVPEDISTPDVESVAARIFPRELLS